MMGNLMVDTASRANPGLLVSQAFLDAYGTRLAEAAREAGLRPDVIALPADPEARLAPEACARVEIAFFSPDIFPLHSRAFFSALRRAGRLCWLHVFNTGVDHPVFQELLERGVELSNSAGTSAEPIAQTAIAGLLALARGLPHWLEAQRQHVWDPSPGLQPPADLRGQTLLVVGLGSIGSHIARLGRALGLYAIGVRRRPRGPGDPVDELHPPSELGRLLPRADWLALACPLSEETRGLIDAAALDRLPRGAHVINVARGALIDEKALVEALQRGALRGAYLDVFETEPLPPDSPLWGLPNVILTPHSSSVSAGNAERQVEAFLRNLVRHGRGAPLENRVPPRPPTGARKPAIGPPNRLD
jgi:phosphoglycerate dehydrogenase-like enzyme